MYKKIKTVFIKNEQKIKEYETDFKIALDTIDNRVCPDAPVELDNLLSKISVLKEKQKMMLKGHQYLKGISR